MRLLLDTHVLLAALNSGHRQLPTSLWDILRNEENELVCSTASLWEIAIKVRLGKLVLSVELRDLQSVCEAFNIAVMPILPVHVLRGLDPPPITRDPFDRLLLAQAETEGIVLVTLDQALVGHASVWRP